ncbi:MAG: hypothetical protein ACU88J_14855 [Gammaproteobacteria bacterium]
MDFLSIITGCASNQNYRTEYTACTVSSGSQCDKHSLQKHNIGADDAYTLGFVEVDDQGQLRNRVLIDSLYQVAVNIL